MQMAIIYQHSPYDSDSDDDSVNEAPQPATQGHHSVGSWVLEQGLAWQLKSVPMLAREEKDIGVFRLTANTMASVSLRPASAIRRKPQAEDGVEPLVIEAQLTLTGKLSNRTSAQGFGVCVLTTYASSRQVC